VEQKAKNEKGMTLSDTFNRGTSQISRSVLCCEPPQEISRHPSELLTGVASCRQEHRQSRLYGTTDLEPFSGERDADSLFQPLSTLNANCIEDIDRDDMDWLRHHFTRLGTYAAHPVAFFVVVAFGIAWRIIEPETLDWHAVATLATLVMTLFIQRSTHRDTQAIHAKLDELLRSDPQAESQLAKLDDDEPEEIEEFRQRQP
jgi:low affinity Fe/Cu permease